MLAARFAEVTQWRLRQSQQQQQQQQQGGGSRSRRELAVVVDGAALAHCVDDDELRGLFLSIVLDCATIVACRVSPRQKAEVVRMVQGSASPAPLTLAIGDGANDVSMLQEAHVGVGVAGNEGMQAVQASDYAICQFAHLGRLLLVHGVWCYDRVCKVAVYMVYKQLVLNGTLFFFNMCVCIHPSLSPPLEPPPYHHHSRRIAIAIAPSMAMHPLHPLHSLHSLPSWLYIPNHDHYPQSQTYKLHTSRPAATLPTAFAFNSRPALSTSTQLPPP